MLTNQAITLDNISANLAERAHRQVNDTYAGASGHSGISSDQYAQARTIMDEVLGERVDLIEHQLAHAVKDPNGRAYNRTAHLPARREMMQRWANYLDAIAAGATVLRFGRKPASRV